MNHIKSFLWRGALAGLTGGVTAALFQWIVTEDQIRKALAIEDATTAGEVHEEMFSRTTQVAGGMSAAVIYGVCIGLVFAFVLAILWRALPGTSAFHRSIHLAVVGFATWVLVPGLKYPPNPPAVGDPDTVGERTAAYLGLMLASLVVAYLCWMLWQRVSERQGNPGRRFAIVAGAYLAAITVLYLVFPANPDAIEVPATLIWHFRIDSFAGNALLWLVMGSTFGILADVAANRAERPVVDRVSVPA